MRGSAQHAGPLAILQAVPAIRRRPFALRAPYPASNGSKLVRGYRGIVLSRVLCCSQATTALAAVAIAVAGCAGANNTASSQGEQPYKTMYGITSEGTTTDLYTEFFGPRKPAAAPETATAAAQPVTASPASPQGATASAASQPAQAATTSAAKGQAKPAVAGTSRQVQPAPVPSPAPVAVAQQPPAPKAEAEPDVPTAYGITANGPTTDLFTELFGSRRRDGQ
jgi:hypothetical protein